MELPDKLFKRREPGKQPEDNHYDIVVTDGYIKVDHYKRKAEQIEFQQGDVVVRYQFNPDYALGFVMKVLIARKSACLGVLAQLCLIKKSLHQTHPAKWGHWLV